MKGERKAGWMRVSGFWPEPGVSWTSKRVERLTSELERFARLASLTLEPGQLPVSRPSRYTYRAISRMLAVDGRFVEGGRQIFDQDQCIRRAARPIISRRSCITF